MALPKLILLNALIYSGTINRKGQLCNLYAPFYNLISSDTKLISELTTECKVHDKGLDFDLAHPVDITPQPAFDGSVNLVINDNKSNPKLINSRFSVQENNTFLVPDHVGFTDTNIYNEDDFKLQTLLISSPLNIPIVTYNGLIDSAGKMQCGVYTFYFKYIDSDGNETAVQAESGLVQCHIGKTNDPHSIRFGMLDEVTDKAISFTLSNIDLAYSFVIVYYTRGSGLEGGAETTTHRIAEKYPINVDGVCQILITGAETIKDVSEKEILVDYADIDSVKTQSQLHNILLFGNVTSTEHDWEQILRMSWKIIPSVHLCDEGEIGYLNLNYDDVISLTSDRSHMYYNTKNVYYRVGYWPLEFYKFGIVYIFDDGSLSPVILLPGVDFTKKQSISIQDLFLEFSDSFGNIEYEEWKFEPQDKWFKKDIINSRGVCRMPNVQNIYYKDRGITARPLYILFNLEHIGKHRIYDSVNFEDELKKHHIKGYFIVRQVREPNILCQGVVIKKSDKDRGNLPLLSHNGQIVALSFLDKYRMISNNGNFACVDNFKPLALISPEVLLQKPVFNDLFTSSKFFVQPVGLLQNSSYLSSHNHYYFNNLVKQFPAGAVIQLTNVNEEVKTVTNGLDYFSTLAGEEADPVKVVDLFNVWDRTLPLTLSTSTTFVRGCFGSYVGMSYNKNISYGHICNVMTEGWENESTQSKLVFTKLINSTAAYHAITDRTEAAKASVKCFRGDCFMSLYTHRMFRNFIDHEYPTNKTIVNAISWAQNFAVRCTAYTTSSLANTAFNNCKKENEGWFLDASIVNVNSDTGLYNLVADRFEIDVARLGGLSEFEVGIEKDGDKREYISYKANNVTHKFLYSPSGRWVPLNSGMHDKPMFPKDILYAESLDPNRLWHEYTFLQQPEPKKTGLKLIDLFITLHNASVHEYVTRGAGNINRADLNAVSLGQWFTFPICASMNIAMRDIDFKQATEEARFNQKRSFFPLTGMDKSSNIPDSDCINRALKTTVCKRVYKQLPDSPFYKLEYFTRIYYSLVDVGGSQENEWKQMLSYKYADYDKQYGSITKLIGSQNRIYIIFQHGIGYITIVQDQDGGLELSTLKVLSDTYGSMWEDSVLETPFGIFGVDTVAKVIWRIQGDLVQPITTRVISKFLIDNIDLSEFTLFPYVGHINVKTHFNANKNDVIFTYYNDIPYHVNQDWIKAGVVAVDEAGIGIDSKGNRVTLDIEGKEVYCYPEKIEFTFNPKTQDWDSFKNTEVSFWQKGKEWSLCYNCELLVFLTFYDWIPLESANIDNIFFTFDRDQVSDIVYGEPKSIKIDLTHLSNYKITTKNNVQISNSLKLNRYTIDGTFNELSDKNTIVLDPSGSIDFSKFEYNQLSASYFGFYIKVVSGKIVIDDNTIEADKKWKFVYGPISKISSPDDSSKIEMFYPIAYFEIPEEVSNIHVCDYTNDKKRLFDMNTLKWRDVSSNMKLWKHGQAGIYDNQGRIKPTNWYNKQREFNFEFVVRPEGGLLGIFNNLKIVSNKTQPNKFEYEIVGEGYEWHPYKAVVYWANEHSGVGKDFKDLTDCYIYILSNDVDTIRIKYPDFPETILEYKSSSSPYVYKKLPYLEIELTDRKGRKDRSYNPDKEDYWKPARPVRENRPNEADYFFNTNETVLKYDELLNEYRIHDELLGNDMLKYGRVRGNMQYLEDYWNIEIRPINFKWAYLYNNLELEEKELKFKKTAEAKHRDKYIKVKVRYTGRDLAVIQAIHTIFDLSYA